ncbi:TRAP transporter large permease [Anaeroselena agilis]|uniref:TRAP transporter large permease n=1 Tax=Anaeroselena agilis TaxID=3063788 RepID=A0ABU3P1L0_9FIRM|nr:TRAP transporter large permease [Selenomonadales bacterium 4137-cl]
MTLLLFASLIVALAIGVPIAFALGLSSLVYLLFTDIPINIIPQRMFSGIDSFVLLCVPGFVLAGNLMNVGGITHRIIAFCMAVVGHIRGGLALANVGASMLFAGISGTAVAETASIGAVMIPSMVRQGYRADYAAALTASASTVGPIIPPSLPMIIAGTISGLSVSRLLIAGAIPGILLGVSLGSVAYLIARRNDHPKGPRVPFREVVRSFFGAFWAILMTLIIVVGIMSGVFTPTEASMVAVVYAIFIGFFVYRELKPRDLPRVFWDSAVTTASLMALVGFANVFAWILTTEEIPVKVAQAMLGFSSSPVVFVLLVNLLLLFVGTFMETIAALMILLPILLKVAVALGIDPIQFSVMCVLNLVVGLTTPPVGVCLFVASSISRVPLAPLTRAVLPFLGVSIAVLLLVSYVPQITLWLPGLMYK